MADQIKVPYGELFSRAKAIEEQASSVEAEVKALQGVIEQLEWMGNRAAGFRKMWEEHRPAMDRWIVILRAFAADLNDQATRMQTFDNN